MIPLVPEHCGTQMHYDILRDGFWCKECGEFVLSADMPRPAPVAEPQHAEP